MLALIFAFLLLASQGAAQQFCSGCIGVTVTPSPGSVLPVSQPSTFELSFDRDVGITSPQVAVVPLASWTPSALLSLASSSPLLRLIAADNSTLVLPTAISSLGNRTLHASFQPPTPPADYFLYIDFAFIGLAPPQLGLPAQGWMPYSTSATFEPEYSSPSTLACPSFPSVAPLELTDNLTHSSTVECSNSSCFVTIQASLIMSVGTHAIGAIRAVSPSGDVYLFNKTAEIRVSRDQVSLDAAILRTISPQFELVTNYSGLVVGIQWQDSTASYVGTLLTRTAAEEIAAFFVTQSNRPWNRFTDPTDVYDMQAAYPTGTYINFAFPDNTVISVRWGIIPPRSGYSWFVNEVGANEGVRCPAGSRRATNCPSGLCPALNFQVGTLIGQPFQVFEVNQSLPQEPITTVLLDGEACSSVENCSSVVTLATEYALPQSHLVLPSDEWVPSVLQDACQWMLIPTSQFGTGCGSLYTGKGTYVSQAGFCDKEPGSCLNPQLGDLWRRPELHVCNLLRNATFDKHTLNYFDQPINLSQVNISIHFSRQSLYQPYLQATSEIHFFPSAEAPLLLRVALNVTNMGNLATSASLDLDCGPYVALERLPTDIEPLESTELVAFLTLLERPHLSNLSCRVNITTSKLPYWQDVVLSSLSDITLPLESNGCWASVPPTTLFYPYDSWETANLTSISEENGLLGPNPSSLQISSFADTSSPYFRVVAQFSAISYGSTSNVSLTANFRCESKSSLVESNYTTIHRVGSTAALESEFFLLGSSQATSWSCMMKLSLLLSPCSSTLGASTQQDFTTNLPASPCFTSGKEQPSLFQSLESLSSTPSSSLDAVWMNFSSKTPWTKTPSTPAGWTTLNLPTPASPISSTYLIVVMSSISNAGNASADVNFNVTCRGVIGFEPALSSSSVAISPSASSSIRLVFVSNSSSPPAPNCIINLATVIPNSVCWSLLGKTYFQNINGWSSAAVAPSSSSKKLPPVAIAMIVIAAVAVVVVAIVTIAVIYCRKPKLRAVYLDGDM